MTLRCDIRQVGVLKIPQLYQDMSTDYSRDLCVTHVTSHVGESRTHRGKPSFVVLLLITSVL